MTPQQLKEGYVAGMDAISKGDTGTDAQAGIKNYVYHLEGELTKRGKVAESTFVTNPQPAPAAPAPDANG